MVDWQYYMIFILIIQIIILILEYRVYRVTMEPRGRSNIGEAFVSKKRCMIGHWSKKIRFTYEDRSRFYETLWSSKRFMVQLIHTDCFDETLGLRYAKIMGNY